MTCPKCKSENQEGIFCSNCANPLKEKCPECGEMEEIGRPACEKKVSEIKWEIYTIKTRTYNRYSDWGIKLAALQIIPLPIALGILEYDPKSRVGGILLVMSILLFIVGLFGVSTAGCLIDGLCKKKRMKEFFRLHPDYAEILKKAKSSDAKSFDRQKEEEK